MPHPWDWSGGQMPHSSRGGGGDAAGIDWYINSHTELGLPVIVTVKAGFNSDGVRVGVVIKSVGLNDLVKTAFWFRLQLRHLQLSENWVVRVTSRSGRTKPITKRGNYIGIILPLLLLTLTIQFSLDLKQQSHKWSQKKMETFRFFRLRCTHDSALMLTTLIFDIHKVISTF